MTAGAPLHGNVTPRIKQMAATAICQCHTNGCRGQVEKGRSCCVDISERTMDARILLLYQDQIVVWHSRIEVKCALHIWLSSVAQNRPKEVCRSLSRPCPLRFSLDRPDRGPRTPGRREDLRVSCVSRAAPVPPPMAHRVACLEIEFCLGISLVWNCGASYPIFKLRQDGFLFFLHLTRPKGPSHKLDYDAL